VSSVNAIAQAEFKRVCRLMGPLGIVSAAGGGGFFLGVEREGITVNAIAPALIKTDIVTSNPKASPGLIPWGTHKGSLFQKQNKKG